MLDMALIEITAVPAAGSGLQAHPPAPAGRAGIIEGFAPTLERHHHSTGYTTRARFNRMLLTNQTNQIILLHSEGRYDLLL